MLTLQNLWSGLITQESSPSILMCSDGNVQAFFSPHSGIANGDSVYGKAEPFLIAAP